MASNEKVIMKNLWLHNTHTHFTVLFSKQWQVNYKHSAQGKQSISFKILIPYKYIVYISLPTKRILTSNTLCALVLFVFAQTLQLIGNMCLGLQIKKSFLIIYHTVWLFWLWKVDPWLFVSVAFKHSHDLNFSVFFISILYFWLFIYLINQPYSIIQKKKKNPPNLTVAL